MDTTGAETRLKIFRTLATGNGRRLALVGVLALLSAAANLSVPMIASGLVGAIQSGTRTTQWVMAMIGVGLGAAVTGALATYLLSVLGQRLLRDLRVRTVRHGLGMRLADVRRIGSGDLTTRLTADAAQIKGALEVGPLQLPLAAVTLVGTVTIMAVLDWALLLVTLAAFGAAAAIVVLVIRGLRGKYGQLQTQIGELAHGFVTVLGSLTVIKACRAEQQVGDDLARRSDRLAETGVSAARMESLLLPVITLGQQIALVGVVIGGGARVLTGGLTLPDFVAFLLYLLQLTAPLLMASSAFATLQAGATATRRFDEVFNRPVEPNGPTAGPPAQPVHGAPAVEFRGVDFAYDDGEPVLHDVDLRVPATGLTAVVGVSGSGKTTALGLVERFLEPAAGTVSVFGRPTGDWPLHDLRGHVAYVDQSFTLVEDTVRRNLTLGMPDGADAVADEQLYAALRRVGLDDAVAALSDGLDTPLGGANDLSGGQRQRLALARALLSEARLVLLDEPSSQLDGVNEQRLRTAVDGIVDDRALLVVAHRLSTVLHADHIVVMHDGRVVGQGTAEQLWETCPRYRDLLAGQAGDRPLVGVA